jgi:hypothetical protein
MNYPELTDLLYHGSAVKVSNIDLSEGATGKDFGCGFYTSSLRDQAAKFAAIKAKRINNKIGYVSVFQYTHQPELNIKHFEKADAEWFEFVLENRGFPRVQKHTFENSCDIIIGPVANDAVGLVLNQFLIGTYGDPLSPDARNTAIRLLNTEKLYNQVFFGTMKAVSCLNFQEAFEIGIN